MGPSITPRDTPGTGSTPAGDSWDKRCPAGQGTHPREPSRQDTASPAVQGTPVTGQAPPPRHTAVTRTPTHPHTPRDMAAPPDRDLPMGHGHPQDKTPPAPAPTHAGPTPLEHPPRSPRQLASLGTEPRGAHLLLAGTRMWALSVPVGSVCPGWALSVPVGSVGPGWVPPACPGVGRCRSAQRSPLRGAGRQWVSVLPQRPPARSRCCPSSGPPHRQRLLPPRGRRLLRGARRRGAAAAERDRDLRESDQRRSGTRHKAPGLEVVNLRGDA